MLLPRMSANINAARVFLAAIFLPLEMTFKWRLFLCLNTSIGSNMKPTRGSEGMREIMDAIAQEKEEEDIFRMRNFRIRPALIGLMVPLSNLTSYGKWLVELFALLCRWLKLLSMKFTTHRVR